MSNWKESARGGVDRLLKPYFVPLQDGVQAVNGDVRTARDDLRTTRDDLRTARDDLRSVSGDLRAVTDEVRGLRESTDTRFDLANMRLHQLLDEATGLRESTDTRFDLANQRLHQLLDEVTGLRESSDTRFDLSNMRLHQILDEVGGVRDRLERLERRFGEVEENLIFQLEGQAKRQAELRSGLDEIGQEMKQAMEKLELLFMAQLEGLFGAVNTETDKLRIDVVELTRMLRMQGDAADQVAEVLGRTLTRLSSEVETLGAAVGELGAGAQEAAAPA